MIIKSHLCGIAVAFDRFEDTSEPDNEGSQTGNPYIESLGNGRYQGSLYSQQKRKIADACEYMRLNAVHKPIIFVATSPGFTDLATEGKLIQKLTHNLKNGYACQNYTWVREFTERGYPHYHFVADLPDFDVKRLSLYWSGLFNSTAANSIRLGSAPFCFKCKRKLKQKGDTCQCGGKAIVDYYLKKKSHAFYLSKYIGKSIGLCERGALKPEVQKLYCHYPEDDYYEEWIKVKRKPFRTFAVSQHLGKLSQPIEFRGQMARTGKIFQAFTMTGSVPIHEEQRVWQFIKGKDENGKEVLGDRVLTDKDARGWNWRYTGFANTFKGYPKEWKIKPIQKPQTKPENIPLSEAPF